MVQNNIWMRYLQLGIIISVISFAISCIKTSDPAYNLDVYFLNQTSYDITYKNGFDKFNVKAKSMVIIRQMRNGISPILTNDSFLSPFLVNSALVSEPFIIYFDTDKCLLQTRTTDNSIFNASSYKQLEKIGNNTYKVTYTFTEADYNRAGACP